MNLISSLYRYGCTVLIFKGVREVIGDHLNTFDSKFKGPSGPLCVYASISENRSINSQMCFVTLINLMLLVRRPLNALKFLSHAD